MSLYYQSEDKMYLTKGRLVTYTLSCHDSCWGSLWNRHFEALLGCDGSAQCSTRWSTPREALRRVPHQEFPSGLIKFYLILSYLKYLSTVEPLLSLFCRSGPMRRHVYNRVCLWFRSFLLILGIVLHQMCSLKYSSKVDFQRHWSATCISCILMLGVNIHCVVA